MIDRRSALMLAAGTAAGLAATRNAGPANADPASLKLTDDGLHAQPWFEQTFLDLAEDAAEAHAQGKSLVVFFEQRGCPYCGEMHKVNLAKPEIVDYIKEHFYALQINLYGSRKVKDFDGTEMEERKLAQRWKVNFTPSLVFFPADPAALKGKPDRMRKRGGCWAIGNRSTFLGRWSTSRKRATRAIPTSSTGFRSTAKSCAPRART